MDIDERTKVQAAFRDYLERIPTLVITHPYPGLEGLKAI